jgi:hypothetical protein
MHPPAASLAIEGPRDEFVLDGVFRAEELRVHDPRGRHDLLGGVTVAGLAHQGGSLLAELRQATRCPQEGLEFTAARHRRSVARTVGP